MGNIPLEWVWTALFAIFVIVELANNALLTIWFAIGALLSAITAFIGLGVPIQIGVFLSASIILLAFTRPMAKKMLDKNKDSTKTNVDSLLGKKAVVVKRISEHEYGQVQVKGQTWTASITDTSGPIEVGESVTIESVSGVKLIVKK